MTKHTFSIRQQWKWEPGTHSVMSLRGSSKSCDWLSTDHINVSSCHHVTDSPACLPPSLPLSGEVHPCVSHLSHVTVSLRPTVSCSCLSLCHCSKSCDWLTHWALIMSLSHHVIMSLTHRGHRRAVTCLSLLPLLSGEAHPSVSYLSHVTVSIWVMWLPRSQVSD